MLAFAVQQAMADGANVPLTEFVSRAGQSDSHPAAALTFRGERLIKKAGVQITRAAVTIVYVDASGTGNGSSWAEAHPSLVDTLAGAASGTEI